MAEDDRLRIAAMDLAVTGAPRALVEAVWLAVEKLERLGEETKPPPGGGGQTLSLAG